MSVARRRMRTSKPSRARRVARLDAKNVLERATVARAPGCTFGREERARASKPSRERAGLLVWARRTCSNVQSAEIDRELRSNGSMRA